MNKKTVERKLVSPDEHPYPYNGTKILINKNPERKKHLCMCSGTA